jgi:hypothetical protein
MPATLYLINLPVLISVTGWQALKRRYTYLPLCLNELSGRTGSAAKGTLTADGQPPSAPLPEIVCVPQGVCSPHGADWTRQVLLGLWLCIADNDLESGAFLCRPLSGHRNYRLPLAPGPASLRHSQRVVNGGSVGVGAPHYKLSSES